MKSVLVTGSNGQLELNVYKLLIIANIVESINLLSDALITFNNHCLEHIIPNKDHINKLLNNSLMLVTALAPYIGYDNCAKIAKFAFEQNISLKESALKLKLLSEEEFNKYVKPEKMV